MTTIPIWLDCDTGHDDAVALLLTARNPSIRLLGVSVVHGNSSVDNTLINTVAVLGAIGRPDVPVYRGSDRPRKLPACYAPDVHGETGLDGVTLLPEVDGQSLSTHQRDAIPAMCDAILAEQPGTVWLLATGPLTNIAAALDARDELAAHIAGLSIMGGAVGTDFTDAPLGTVEGEGSRFGNTTPWAEFNIYADPHAADRVFSDAPLSDKTTLVTLDLSHNTRVVQSVREQLFLPGQRDRSVVRRLFEEIISFFGATYHAQFAISDGPPLHDPLTVLAALHPAWLDDRGGERFEVSVVLGERRWDKVANREDHVGQTVVKPARGGKGVRVPRGVELDKFWSLIDQSLRLVEESSF